MDAARIKRALMVTARPTPGAEYLDEGRGLPALDAAWTWLASAPGGGEVTVAAAGGGDAGWRVLGPGVARSGTLRFAVSPSDSAPAGPLRLESDVAWLTPPARVSLQGGGEVTLRYDAAKLPPGVHTGTVLAWSADTLRGPAFRLVATLVLPAAATAGPTASARPRRCSRARSSAPSSWPIRRGRSSPASRPTASPAAPSPSCTSRTERPIAKRPPSRPAARPQAAEYDVDGRDAVAGAYEVDAVTSAGPERVGGRDGSAITAHPARDPPRRPRGGPGPERLARAGHRRTVAPPARRRAYRHPGRARLRVPSHSLRGPGLGQGPRHRHRDGTRAVGPDHRLRRERLRYIRETGRQESHAIRAQPHHGTAARASRRHPAHPGAVSRLRRSRRQRAVDGPRQHPRLCRQRGRAPSRRG